MGGAGHPIEPVENAGMNRDHGTNFGRLLKIGGAKNNDQQTQ